MEEKCKNCVRICKWLDATDKPEIYRFTSLISSDVLTLIEVTLKNYSYKSLRPKQFARSFGNQLAVTFSPLLDEIETSSITFIAQCEKRDDGCELWFRFAVDDEVCGQPVVADEFHRLLNEMIISLVEKDVSSAL